MLFVIAGRLFSLITAQIKAADTSPMPSIRQTDSTKISQGLVFVSGNGDNCR